MIEVENSILVKKPPRDVFGVVGNLENEPQWHTDVATAKKLKPGPVAVGTTYEFRPKKPMMGVDRVEPRVVKIEPGKAISFDTQFGKMLIHRTYKVEPAEGGSRVSHRFVAQPKGMMRLMAPMMKRSVRKAWVGFLENLKQVVEAENPQSGRRA
jgi:uncharacterized protein YndB with AHSA1/START domain